AEEGTPSLTGLGMTICDENQSLTYFAIQSCTTTQTILYSELEQEQTISGTLLLSRSVYDRRLYQDPVGFRPGFAIGCGNEAADVNSRVVIQPAYASCFHACRSGTNASPRKRTKACSCV